MNALLVANWPLLIAFFGGLLLGVGVGWLLRAWREPDAPTQAGPERAKAVERRAANRPERRAVVTPAAPLERRTSAPYAGPMSDEDEGAGPAILLIDDRLELLGIHAAYLRKHGYRTLLADSGRTGLAFARQYRPELIVLDHSMPDLTGTEVARELKSDPATAHIPILLMTALSYGAVGAAALDAGCEAFLSKPIEPSRLLREIELRTRPPKH